MVSSNILKLVKKGQFKYPQIRVNYKYALQANGHLGYVHMHQEGSVWVNKVQIVVSCIHVGSGGILRG